MSEQTSTIEQFLKAVDLHKTIMNPEWMNRLESVSVKVAPDIRRLIVAADTVIKTFEELGRTEMPAEWLRKRTACERAMVELKKALPKDRKKEDRNP